MRTPPIVQRHPSLRWLVPAAVITVAGLSATGLFQAEATSEKLPKTSPRALLAAAQEPQLTGFSGTVVSRFALGLPELPALPGRTGDGAAMSSLLSGSHTLQVWYGGPTQQRVALLGTTEETDLFRSGRQMWQWSSADRVAVHAVLPKHTKASGPKLPTPSTITPSDLAGSALNALDPSTRVTVRDNVEVANRSAYMLVLKPRAAHSRIGAVHISLDGKTKVPLGVQVFPRGSKSAAIDVAFTSIRFDRPAKTSFEFTPPDGATVRKLRLAKAMGPDGDIARRLGIVGKDWTSVVTYRTGKPITLSGPLQRASEPVSGSWGRGRLVESRLVNVLITSKGRVYAGAVDPSALYAAAAN